ncbi:MAG: DUF4407 domain-containing protein [bacterium]|nr:DUF4407 domain-containing protein [bacterium]
MRCHACDAEVELAAGEAIGFRAECDRCAADLHVCLNCDHHDPGAYNECREPSAERVRDRDRANRCEYFRFRTTGGTGDGPEAERRRAQQALDALFGDD